MCFAEEKFKIFANSVAHLETVVFIYKIIKVYKNGRCHQIRLYCLNFMTGTNLRLQARNLLFPEQPVKLSLIHYKFY